MQGYTLIENLGNKLKPFFSQLSLSSKRQERWEATRKQRAQLHDYLQSKFLDEFSDTDIQLETGLDFAITRRQRAEKSDYVQFEVHSMWPVQRQRPDGSVLNQVVFSILQHRPLSEDKESPHIWGGCTFIVDLDKQKDAVRYVIRKPLFNQDRPGGRITTARESLDSPETVSLATTYAMNTGEEPFAMLHTEF